MNSLKYFKEMTISHVISHAWTRAELQMAADVCYEAFPEFDTYIDQVVQRRRARLQSDERAIWEAGNMWP